jgi:hypothetical protein
MSDAERLAALMDGRLDERQRHELLERLSLSEEDLQVLADAGAITHEMEEEDLAATPAEAAKGAEGIPPSHTRRRPARYRRWLPVAAVLAGIAVTGVYVGANDAELARSPVSVVDRLSDAKLPPPKDFRPAPWPGARGGADRAGRFAAGVRIGAGLTDLQLAAARGDPALGTYADEVAELLNEARLAPKEAAFYEGLSPRRGAPRAVSERGLKKHAAAVAAATDSAAVALGAWAQAARLAAVRRDTAFFDRTRQTVAAFPDAPRGITPPAAAALGRIKAASAGAGPKDWPQLGNDLDVLLGAEAR